MRGFAILFATVLVVTNFASLLSDKQKQGEAKATVAVERAEIPLRLMSTINVGVARLYANFGSLNDSSGKSQTALELGNKSMGSFFKGASVALEKAIKDYPNSVTIKAKLVIVLANWAQPKDRKRIEELCADISHLADPKKQELAAVLKAVYVDGKVYARDRDRYSFVIDSQLQKGWFRDNIKLALLRAADDSKGYRQLNEEIEEKYLRTCKNGIIAIAVILLSCLTGVVVIIMQLGSLARGQLAANKVDNPLGPVGLSTVYVVFLAWLLTQAGFGMALKSLPKGLFHLEGDPVTVAVFTLVTYLLNMGPALLFVYLIALRPQQKKFVEALGLRLHVGEAGPLKLIFAGVLTWCAMFPLVMLSAAIAANVLHSQGSDNAIVAQIIAAANSQKLLATILLYFTLAVLAPFFEELIFRSFLYASLRQRIGVFFSMVLSALVFASIHFDQGGILMLFTIGFVLAFCYERCRSIVPCMVAHGLWNGGSFTMALMLFSS